MLIDLSHTIKNNMPVYPGDKPPSIVQSPNSPDFPYITHYELNLGSHTGTHIDAPMHMIKSGAKISKYALENFTGRGIIISAKGEKQIDANLLKQVKISKGDIAVLYTGWSKKYGKPEYFTSGPKVTEAFAKNLVKLKVKMLGIDFASPDAPPFVVHKILLSNNILIMENLTNLHKLTGKKFDIIALPMKLETDGSPARVIAITHKKLSLF